jgi:hypothetical protein
MQQSAIGFETGIRPLFGEDARSMSCAFDLSPDDARANADNMLRTVAVESTPCDGRWPAERVDLFRGSVDAGCPA